MSTPPPTRRSDHVDHYHGRTVADPYRWLEDTGGAETRAWIDAQNAATAAFLDAIPQRPAIRARLQALWDHEKWGVPWRRGGRTFEHHNDGLQNQDALYVRESSEGERRLLLDPNTLSKDGTVAVASSHASRDGKRLVYGIRHSGSDWTQWRVRDVDSGEDLADRIAWSKFSAAEWAHDGSGFYYGGYERPADGDLYEAANVHQKLYFHRLGTDQAQDVVVLEDEENADYGFMPRVSDDGRYLVVAVWRGSAQKNLIYLQDFEVDGAPFIHLIPDWAGQFIFLGTVGTTLYFQTDLDAPRSRVVSLDLDAGTADVLERLHEVVAESDATLLEANLVGDRLILNYLEDAHARVRVFELDGTHVHDVELPGLGTVVGFDGGPEDDDTFFAYTSYRRPLEIHRYDLAQGTTTLVRRPEVGFDVEGFETHQVFFRSKDGTRVPMFLTHRKGLALDGSNPTYLYGYGGFNNALTPAFSPVTLAWLEMGGIFAVANLRGGGEYGHEWHRAGTKERKQNVFDDFIAAAEWLIEERYTSTPKLAIGGGSNGGLLVGACMTQRPDLYGACVPAVGVMDMLRYHEFTIGWAWKSDYGCSDDPDEFETLLAYSPLHNIREGVHYPPTLVVTSDHDDRVVPSHSYKFTAALQHAQGGDAPVLIRIDIKAGHGLGTPTRKILDAAADRWAFLARALAVPVDAVGAEA